MSKSAPPPAGMADALGSLAALEDDESRRDFFRSHEELKTTGAVEALCAEASKQLWVDVERAANLAAAARWLARDLGENLWLARSTRIAANTLHRAGETERAQELYRSALDRFSSLGEEREGAITRSSALLNMAYLGDYEAVYRWEEAAREVFARLGDALRLAILEHNFANILCRQDRWKEALGHYETAYREFLQLGRSQDVAICLRNMAVCHINLLSFTDALEVHHKNRVFCQEQGLTRLLLEVDYNIAYLHYLRGEYTRAIQLFQETRRRCEAEGDDYHKALCDLDQAEIYLELNLVEEAAELASRAFASFDQLKLPYESAKALTNQAIATSRLGRNQRALELLRQAGEIFRREKNRLWLALIDFYQAVVLQRQRLPEDAFRLAESAREAFAESGINSRAALCEILLAELELLAGRPRDAERICRDALEHLADLELPALEHQAYRVLGQAAEAFEDHEMAFDAYRQARRRLEQLRSQLQGERLKISFLEDKHSVYESLVWLTLRRGSSQEHQMEAFDAMEQAKSRALADLLSVRSRELPSTTPKRRQVADRVRRLREELSWYYRQIDRAQMRAEQEAQTEAQKLRRASRDREEQLLRALRELQSADQELSSLQPGFRVDLDTLRSSLPEESILVEYFIARGAIFVALVDRRRIAVRQVSTSTRARQLHRLLQLQLSKMALGGERLEAALPLVTAATHSHLCELYDELIRPIRTDLDRRHLILAPHGFLHYVPFQALHDGERYLIEDFSLSYIPSGGVFHLCSAKEAVFENHSLVLGVSDDRAPYILDEARAVADSLPNARLLEGEEATGKALERFGANSRFIHIASHGLFRRDNPLFSAIQLGRTRLSLFDLYQLRMAAELVVLSGCGTGLNAVLGADELVGLTRGFLYAGARSVLVTLWDVNDASTAEFMGTFYRHLNQGIQRAEALRLATHELRESHPHPYYWAPFVLVGQPGSLRGAEADSWAGPDRGS